MRSLLTREEQVQCRRAGEDRMAVAVALGCKVWDDKSVLRCGCAPDYPHFECHRSDAGRSSFYWFIGPRFTLDDLPGARARLEGR